MFGFVLNQLFIFTLSKQIIGHDLSQYIKKRKDFQTYLPFLKIAFKTDLTVLGSLSGWWFCFTAFWDFCLWPEMVLVELLLHLLESVLCFRFSVKQNLLLQPDLPISTETEKEGQGQVTQQRRGQRSQITSGDFVRLFRKWCKINFFSVLLVYHED